jgi:dUTP pyrophosphatase
LYASETVMLRPAKPTLVPTNLEIAIPQGTMLLILPRSGIALKRNLLIPNSPGLIDEDYRGHLQIILTYFPDPSVTRKSPEDWICVIQPGERIAQAVLMPYFTQTWVKVESLPSTERGAQGFGSTGQ